MGSGDQIVVLLRDFASVAAARVGNDGSLVEANATFQALIGGPPADGRVRAQFLEPAFDQISASPAAVSQCIHSGTLRIGDPAEARSLRGSIYRVEGGYLVLAEMAQLTGALASLQRQLQDKQEALARTQQELDRRKSAMEVMLLTDPLTGLPNRRKLEETLDLEVERARRYRTPLSVALADVDRFGEVNQLYGRDAGDGVLRRVAQVIHGGLRRSDLPARYEQDRFLALLPHAKLQGAVALSERLRAQISIAAVPEVQRPTTASFGVTEFQDTDSLSSLLERAGAALRRAKNAGGNRVAAGT
ncbi:MAG TPA: GGDEF domain-containing protein [Burkholderiales bacterium]|nr:GGDEF domain-containing protein [Burkholderiales bacterium]